MSSFIDPGGEVQRHGQRATVAVCRSAAAAQFVATTLSVNGIAASTGGYSAGLYPSVDWAEGYRVEVEADEAAIARALLSGLRRDDVATIHDEA